MGKLLCLFGAFLTTGCTSLQDTQPSYITKDTYTEPSDTNKDFGKSISTDRPVVSQPAFQTDTGITSDTSVEPAELTIQVCIENTQDTQTCHMCCDCAEIECDERKSCRKMCDVQDFDKNSVFVTFDYDTEYGFDTDDAYLGCIMRGEEAHCKQCCDCNTAYFCGDLKYCRIACENMF